VTFVLLYHDVVRAAEADSAGFPGPLAGRYKLEPELFEAHLDAIEAAGLVPGLVVPDAPFPHLGLSFDDAGSSAPVAASLLEARGWRGHFFVPTAWVGRPGFLGPEGVRELAGRGHAVGSHSHTHPRYMARLTPAEIADEWRKSRAILGELLGEAPATASVPGGSVSPEVLAGAAKAGYSLVMTSDPVSRPSSLGPATILGRFGIWSSTSAERAVAYARGRRLPCTRLWLEWRAKKLAKRVSPATYEWARGVRARSS
jgi:peptidoglycan/xylan/chitin deacetylase (PgdA/CDA1 family)